MIKPSIYEDLRQSTIVIGAEIIKCLKKKDYNIEELFNKMKDEKGINLYQFYNVVTFLWLSEVLVYENYRLKLID